MTTEAPGRKRPGAAAPASPGPNRLDCFDQAQDACRTLEMFTALMANQSDQPLEGAVIQDAGFAMREQLRQLRQALAKLKGAP